MRFPGLIVPLSSILLVVAASSAQADYELENAFPNLSFQGAVDIQAAATSSNSIYVADKSGIIWVFPELATSGPADRTVFLDLSGKVTDSGEAGLLGLAFHPGYAVNGYFFVYYVTPFPYRNVLARYHVSANPLVADPNSELVLIDDPKTNIFHNGGQIAFGRNYQLYVAIGDDTRRAEAQQLDDLFGSILRITPNIMGITPAYTIPKSNPFKGNANGYREEVFAYGFRNPWRFSIDPATEEVWVADVGENTYEEVDVLESGGNYGWPLMEGPQCFEPASCDTAGKDLQLPHAFYTHALGSAVIGGHVYRGTRLLDLAGKYIFGDLNGTIWSLTDDGVNPPVRSDVVPVTPLILTFGVGNVPQRELYVSCADGSIYRLRQTVTAADGTPRPGESRLLGNFPNPFNPATTIRYQLERAGRVAVEIVTVGGTRVRLIDQGTREAGTHSLPWRGETDAGTRAASGVYFYRLIVDGVARDSDRMVLLQ